MQALCAPSERRRASDLRSTPRLFRRSAAVLVLLSCSPIAAAAASAGAGADIPVVLQAATPVAVTFMATVLVLKVTAFVLGYFIVRLGHDTLIRGVTGEIDFGFTGSAFGTKLKAASPGTFFVLMGAAVIIWGLFVQKPLDISYRPQPQVEQRTGEPTPEQGPSERIEVPD